MKLQHAALLFATQLSWLVGPATSVAGPPARQPWSGCSFDTVGLDTSLWNTGRGTFLGRALGQTFFAKDTIIRRVTVWRPPNIIDVVGAHLFVTTVDTTQTPARPVTQGILQDGPTVTVRDSDPPGQLIRMDFLIDPPVALPRPGVYAFFIQRDACDLGETRLIASTSDPYPYGIYWLTGRTLECGLRTVDGGEDFTDLIFEIEFCRTNVTPVRARSWGDLKLLYR